MTPNTVFKLLTAALFFALLLPFLVQDGMFVDGITYSAIAHNMANGIGSFWQPHYSETLYPVFYEHPPLVMGIQALFFKLLGSAFYVERLYSLLTAIGTALGIGACWRLFFYKKTNGNYSWLPIALWISIPVIFWAFRNNLLENTMGLCTLWAIFSFTKGLRQEQLLWLVLGSVLVVFAFLAKGFVGLFPLAVAFIYYLIFQSKSIGRALIYTSISVLLPLLIFGLLWILIPELQENITAYCQQQLLPALNGSREVTTHNRFAILGQLLLELSFPIILLLFFVIKNRRKLRSYDMEKRKVSLYFFLIGVSASLPLMVSLKQRKFYLTPSIPFFLLALSIVLLPYLRPLLESLSSRILNKIKYVAYAIIIGVLGFSILQFGNYSRDAKKLADIYILAEKLPKATIFSTNLTKPKDWGLIAYLARVGSMSLDYKEGQAYFLTKKEIPDLDMETYEEVDIGLLEYRLFRKEN